MPIGYRGLWSWRAHLTHLIFATSLALGSTGCDQTGGGDQSCPEGTIRSGNSCILAGEEMGGVGPVSGEEAGERSGGDTSGGVAGGDQSGTMSGDEGGSTPPVISFPIVIDQYFYPSGFMGEGEVNGITADFDCPERPEMAEGNCHHFTYTPGEIGWGGVWWQSPDGNWGDEPGVVIPEGATQITFTAWGANGGEVLSFGSGYGTADGFAVKLGAVTLSEDPQTYTIDIAGVPYQDLKGAFYWVTESGDEPQEFYLDHLLILNTPTEIDPCVVTCAIAGAVEGCVAPDYISCKDECNAEINGECASEGINLRACIIEEGWSCVDETLAVSLECESSREALEACTGGPQATPLPFNVADHFVMSGYMGGGDVEVEPCDLMEARPDCQKITWTPAGSEWVGFFFQYPENNWGELPGLMIESGATHVRYRAWGETGTEVANFVVGIADADDFSVETGYGALSESPEESAILVPEGITELTGAFAWFLENPESAETITFYLDGVEWRADAPPSTGEGIPGCMNSDANNYNNLAEVDDGSCLFDVTFNVDMTCSGVEFTTVFITGPFCNWCDGGFPLEDVDGDGIWSATYPFPAGDLEYKYMVDAFASQEDLVDDVSSGAECAPITDSQTYANRNINVNGVTELNEVYGRCSACSDEPPMEVGPFETIDFDQPDVTYTLIGFEGAESSSVVPDPADANNTVGQVVKSDAAQPWAGTTVVTRANNAVGRVPLDAENTRMTVRVYSPHAGIAVRVKLEDASDSTVTVETEATVTAEGQWETLTFDFASPAANTAAFNPSATYNKLSIFFNFGQSGADAGERTYFFDDITFIGGTGGGGDPQEVTVTFNVDMTCAEAPESFNVVYITGPFCEWCGEGYPLSDPDGDGVWSGVFTFPAGAPLEYKYMVDGFASQEDLVDDVAAGDGACAPITDGVNFANRQITPNADVTLNELYGRCSTCLGDGLGANNILTEEDGWRLTWSDEFNGAANTPVDPAKWTHDVGGAGWGNAQLEHNTARVENVSHTGDGYLAITARREDYQGNEYTSGRIKTQGLFSQTYGRYEARIQLPYGQGIWPAFWMLGDDISTVSWPQCGEIDIMEFRGQNLTQSTAAIHGPGYSGGQSLYGAYNSLPSLAAGFHTYAVEWSPTTIKWYVDGTLFMEKSSQDIPNGAQWVFDHNFFLLLNVAVGGNYVGSPDASTRFPQQMRVDYVRVYEAVP